MGFHLAQFAAELVEAISVFADVESGQDDLVNLAGAPAGDQGTVVHEHLHQADHARVMDPDAGIAYRS